MIPGSTPDSSPCERGCVPRLIRLTVERPVAVLAVLMTIMVTGAIAMTRIPRELMPRGYEGSTISVSVGSPDIGSQEALDKLTQPLEEELSTVKRLDTLFSSSYRGGASVSMVFASGTDMDVAYREVRDRVERARARFPDDVSRVTIRKEDLSGIPIAALGVIVEPGLTGVGELVDREVVVPLERLDGVASVRPMGLLEQEVRIDLDRKAVERAGLNVYQLAAALQRDNFTMASGHVREAGRSFLLKSVATYRSVEELENRRVSRQARLRDVGEVSYGPPESFFRVRMNGKPAFALFVQKEGEANTVEVSRAVERLVGGFASNPRLSGVRIEPFMLQGRLVEGALGEMVGGGRVGALLAAVVLFFFLRQLRMTVLISLAVPLSLWIAVTVLYFAGETLNILTILGLVICVGLLLDNSVVVSENILRHFSGGLDRMRACVVGASEVGLAILLATLTTVIVFLPVALVEGRAQFFLLRLALPITVALIASLFVALLLVPLAVSRILSRDAAAARGRGGRRARVAGAMADVTGRVYHAVMDPVERFYLGMLRTLLRRRLDLFFGLAVVFAATGFVAKHRVRLALDQQEKDSGFFIGATFAPEFEFADVLAVFDEVETVMADASERFPIRNVLTVAQQGRGEVQGWMETDAGDVSARDVARDVFPRLPRRPGVEWTLGRRKSDVEGSTRQLFAVRIEGEDPGELDALLEELRPLFLQVPGVIGSRPQEENQPLEIALQVDRDRASSMQVNPEAIAGVVGYALRGRELPRFYWEGREIPVRVRFRSEDRSEVEDLSAFRVPVAGGTNEVPVRSVTSASVRKVPSGIFRINKRVGRTLHLELADDDPTGTRRRLEALQARLDLPEGIRFSESEKVERNEEIRQMVQAMVLSIIFIYLLMGILFESFLLPVSIILTIPLAGLGVVWSHAAAGMDMDFLGLVGIVLLIGVVVNNGIVFVDYVNRLRMEGCGRRRAVFLATRHRFRPILMTALTTIVGMIPLTVAEPGELGLSYRSFGTALIGGMTTATLLTLWVVPVFYTLCDDLRTWWIGLRAG